MDFNQELNDVLREWEVTTDGRLWPCCYYANLWNESKMHLDPTLSKEFEKDPDWNDLSKHTLDEITKNPMYNSYIHPDGWNSENPPPVCKLECSVRIDQLTGEEVSGSSIDQIRIEN